MSAAAGDFDVAIAGAGPAGCSTALASAAAGARVVLLERGEYPRQKVCGEFVSPEGLALLGQLDPLLTAELLDCAPRISRGRLFLDGRCIEVQIAPAAASVTRFALDDALWRAAIRAGVECREKVAVHRVREHYLLESGAGEVRAKSVVIAAGRWSNLRTPQGEIRHSLIGLKAHYAEAQPPDSVDLYFFQGGYCGAQIVREGHVNVCAVVDSNVATSLPEVFLLNSQLRERSNSWSLIGSALSTAPLVFGDPAPTDGELLYVGDAAGFIDPFIGDGISLALRSGRLAAECLTQVWRAQASADHAAEQYALRYQKEIRPLFRNAAFLRRMTSMQGALRTTALAALQIPAIARWVLNSTRASA